MKRLLVLLVLLLCIACTFPVWGNLAGLPKPVTPYLNRAHPLSQGLISCYPLTEGPGATQIHDVCQVANGTLSIGSSGIQTWGGGEYGYSYSTSIPTGAYSNSGNNALNIAGNITVAALYTNISGGSASVSQGLFIPAINSGNLLYTNLAIAPTSLSSVAQFAINNNGSNSPVNSAASYADGLVHLFIGRVIGTTQEIWVDGSIQGTKSITSNNTIVSVETSVAGNVLGTKTASGKLHGCWMWNRALSQNEMTLFQQDPFAMLRIGLSPQDTYDPMDILQSAIAYARRYTN